MEPEEIELSSPSPPKVESNRNDNPKDQEITAEPQQTEPAAPAKQISPPKDPQITTELEKTEPEKTEPTAPTNQISSPKDPQKTESIFSTSSISTWAKSFKILQPTNQEGPESQNTTQSAFTRISSGLGLRLNSVQNETGQTGIIGSLTKGIVDSSKNAVKAVQVKARHMVSQNKRRFQEDGFDLDMTYITENIIAMGFPAGDLSSGLFGYFEGFYRNHMEEVIRFFETHHKGNYKVYNLCSERLYDASLLEGKVACFPFDDHNCPPMELIKTFCESASSWLKLDSNNVVVVHCKAGKARTGLMISSLLLYLKMFPTAEECMDYFNQKRCVDGKGLILPSQIRYVKYFEHILNNLNGAIPLGRRCMLRGFRLHKCPHWIRPSITVSNHNGILFSSKKHPRTKDLAPEDFWFSTPQKGIMVFGLPGEPGLAEIIGDFKVQFHDRQGEFYCWLNTTMTENRKFLNPQDLDGFDKRKLPSPGFQVEVVLLDYDGSQPLKPTLANINFKKSKGQSNKITAINRETTATSSDSKNTVSEQDKDDVFSDSDTEESRSSNKTRRGKDPGAIRGVPKANITQGVEKISLKEEKSVKESNESGVNKMETKSGNSSNESEFKAISADASVFSFGDDEDYETE